MKSVCIISLLASNAFLIFLFFEKKEECNSISEGMAFISVSQMTLSKILGKGDFKKADEICIGNIRKGAIHIVENDLKNPNLQSFIIAIVNNKKNLRSELFSDSEWEMLTNFVQKK